jgi:hypothetical protein
LSIGYGINISKQFDANTTNLPLFLPSDKAMHLSYPPDGNSALCREHRDFLPFFKIYPTTYENTPELFLPWYGIVF